MEGEIMFTMDQKPYLQTYLRSLLAYLHLRYGFTPSQKLLLTGPGIITKDNMAGGRCFILSKQLLDRMRRDGIPEKILGDLQSLQELQSVERR